MHDEAWNDTTLLRYERTGNLVRLTLRGLTNHELREVLLGLWCRLDVADRVDHIEGLTHYATDPDAWISPVASAVKQGDTRSTAIDLNALAARGERIKP